MKLEICSVYDRALGAFLPPFFCPAVGLATRSFLDECGGDGPIGKHPADYELHHLGEFDDGTGRFLQFDQTKLLMKGAPMKAEVRRVS